MIDEKIETGGRAIRNWQTCGENYDGQWISWRHGGNKIILFTARGTTTGVDWEDLTRKQLETWNVSYDDLLFGKPEADVYIDDKANDIFGWFLKN